MASAVVNSDIRNAEAQQLVKLLGTRRFPPGPVKIFQAFQFSLKLEHFNAGTVLLQLSNGDSRSMRLHLPSTIGRTAMFR